MHYDPRHLIRRINGDVVFQQRSEQALRAEIEEAVESGFDLTGTSLSSAYSLNNGHVVITQRRNFRDLRLREALLEDARLSATDFRGADFQSARLSRSMLDYANFDEADFTGAFMEGISAKRARFVGANLRGANLASSQLPWADFTDADLRGADLRGANLRAANLTNALLDDAQTSGVKIGALTKTQGASLAHTGLTHEQFAWTKALGWAGAVLVTLVILSIVSYLS